jgi:2-haloacid dehalogenase
LPVVDLKKAGAIVGGSITNGRGVYKQVDRVTLKGREYILVINGEAMPANQHFQGIKAFVFDAYGTLFDVHSAIGRHSQRLGEFAVQISNLWRSKQLEYTWLRSLMGQHADFWQVTAEALDYALISFDIDDRDLERDLMEAYLHLDCHPDVPGTLRRLKEHGLQTAILSNGSPAMLDAAVKNSGLSELIEGIFSVEEVGIFKPDPRVYKLAADRLGLATGDIAFLSSNSWDVAGAAAFGFCAVWINRFSQQRERLPFGPAVELKSLAVLPDLLES